MANLNTPSIWGNFPKSGEGFSDKAFSGNPNMTTNDALKQLKGRKVEATQTRDPNT